VGAGFYQLSVGIKDFGEPAPTKSWFFLILKKNFISCLWVGAGFYPLFVGIKDFGEPAPTKSW